MLIKFFVVLLSVLNSYTLKMIKISENPLLDWEVIIKNAFFDKNCIHLFTSSANISTEIITATFKGGTISVYQNLFEQIDYCSGYVFVANNLTDLKHYLMKTRRWGEDRFLCIVEDTDHSDLLQFLQDTYNFNGQQMSVSTFNCSVFSKIGNVDQHGIPDWVGGVEMQLFKNIAQRLNVTWKINVMGTEERWGRLLENGTWSDGILKRVADGTSDIGFCTIWLSEEKDKYFEMSIPWRMITQRLLIPRPTTLKTHWYAIFNPFSYKLWVIIVLTTFVSSILLHALVKMYNKLHELSASNNSLLSNTFIMIGILLLGNFPCSKSYKGTARPFVTLWTIYSLLVVTAYSSSLVAHLTSPLFAKQISSLQELVENGYVWSSIYRTDDKLLFDNTDEWHKKFLEHFILETSEDTRASLIETKKYVFHGKSFDEKFIVVDTEDLPYAQTLNAYEASQFYLKQFFVGFVFRKGTPYAEVFDMYILRFHSSGILGKILGDLFYMEGLKHPYVVNAFKKYTHNLQGPTKLQVVNLKGAFFVLIIGLILATAVLLVECAV